MGVKGMLARAGGKAANQVAKLAALSPQQLEKVQADRERYLSQKPDPSDAAAEELTKRLLAASSVEIYNAYLAQLKQLYVPVVRTAEYGENFDASRNIRFFNITKWVVDKDENSLEKLVNVYEVLSNEDCNISLVFHRTCETTHVYLAVTNTQNADNNVDVENYRIRLEDAIRGNFPGSEWSSGKHSGKLPCLDNDIPYSVAAASNIPAEKSEKFISQTIEKLLDGIVPESRSKEYIVILLATPVRDIESRKMNLAEMYSGLAPYASWQTSFTYDEHSATGSSATVGVNIGASAGIQNGQNQAVTSGQGTTDSESNTDTESNSEGTTESTGESTTESTGSSVTDSTGNSVSGGTSTARTTGSTHTDGTSSSHMDSSGNSASKGGSAGISTGGLEASVNISQEVNSGISDTVGSNISDSVTETLGRTTSRNFSRTTGQAVAEIAGKAVGKTVGTAVATTTGKAVAKTLGHAVSHTASKTVGAFQGVNFGANFGANFARSSNVTATIGKSEGIHQNFTNYNIKHALENLEAQMKRLELSTALGMWDFAAYVLSEDQNVANNVAHSYVALTQGAESYMSQSAINLWRGNMGEDSGDAREICEYLRELRHPVFGLNPAIMAVDSAYMVYPPVVTATTSLSGKELAYSLNFPRKSVPGLPVIECAEFGRNIATYDLKPEKEDEFELGRIFHMHHEERALVYLSKNSLASHTFITGSTGSGKSNTVYEILDNAMEQNVNFMVIEPAKGEYKHVFGGMEEITVLGTNPSVSRLLRLNPFSFPTDTHILEHLDRLIEIFNVCWPMYAAMPAVLKNATEKAYEDCGWDLASSRNRYDELIYPTFADVARNIKEIIDSSEYDAENKGAYKGSLLTRLQSLTNGINGMIFGCKEIPAEELFNQNVIVDLSRVGSSETKSLLMGILILKLQEYRMSEAQMNSTLRHITVLEEAHNLLKRTSSEQSSESGNLLGKSVEMLANAIAEMRTYGEGFVIADQAPGLLDLSVIRNTNTKIIMRLPDLEDRKLVGHAAGLNDQQIGELAKLPCGVAAVYQNEWIQPVLCKVKKYETEPYAYLHQPEVLCEETNVSQTMLDFIMKQIVGEEVSFAARERLKEQLLLSKFGADVKVSFVEYLEADSTTAVTKLQKLVYNFFAGEKLMRQMHSCPDVHEWSEMAAKLLSPSVLDYASQKIDLILMLILQEQAIRDVQYTNLLNRFVEIHIEKGGVS